MAATYPACYNTKVLFLLHEVFFLFVPCSTSTDPADEVHRRLISLRRREQTPTTPADSSEPPRYFLDGIYTEEWSNLLPLLQRDLKAPPSPSLQFHLDASTNADLPKPTSHTCITEKCRRPSIIGCAGRSAIPSASGHPETKKKRRDASRLQLIPSVHLSSISSQTLNVIANVQRPEHVLPWRSSTMRSCSLRRPWVPPEVDAAAHRRTHRWVSFPWICYYS